MKFATVATREFTMPSFHSDKRSTMTSPHTIEAGCQFIHSTRETAQQHTDKNNATLGIYGGDCWVVLEVDE